MGRSIGGCYSMSSVADEEDLVVGPGIVWFMD